MPPLPVSLIAACSLNRVIGRQGRLPWTLPCDWAFFATATQRQVLVVGRRSFQEFGAPVANRHTIVVSASLARSTHEQRLHPDVAVVASLDDAIAIANADATYAHCSRIFIGGGERLFREALDRDLVDSCYISRVHVHIPDGDATLPPWTHRCPDLRYASFAPRAGGGCSGVSDMRCVRKTRAGVLHLDLVVVMLTVVWTLPLLD
ncbi:hypothetical protein PINS_up011266 [Pythium insidiosum]|nr:hypothetical protein PINS_up011266 [Pythium insidiosum]